MQVSYQKVAEIVVKIRLQVPKAAKMKVTKNYVSFAPGEKPQIGSGT